MSRNFVVIGGSSGIGSAIVNQLSTLGHRVFATYNHTDVSGISLPNVSFHHLDVTDENLDFSWVPEVVHGVVYCPGAIALLPFGRLKQENILTDFQLQVVGAVNVLQNLLPQLKKSGSGSVVLFSTVAVQTGFNFHSQVAISKGAIEGLTRSLAAEMAPTIRVNAIAPSITNTPLASKFLSSDEKVAANEKRHPLQRIGSSEDIAQSGVFLLTESSSWITGQILKVDGGISTIKI